MKIPQFFSRIPFKKYIAGFLVSAILISQTIHVDFFDSAMAGPENYRDIISIIVDEDTYSSQRTKILRYADDIAGYLGGVRTSIFVVDKNTPVSAIATKNEKLYYEGDGEGGTSILVGTVLIGNIPIPMVEKDGTNFPSLYPYVDFDDKVFTYNTKSEQYSFNQENNGVESPEIWHGVINPATGRNWLGATDIQKIGQFLDKTHDFYTKSGKFVPSTVPPKVFYYDGLSEGKSINARALFQYSLYIKNIENMAYSRYTKYLLRDITKILNDYDKKTADPEITDMFAELGISPGNDTLSEDQIKKIPDIQSKNVILGFLKNFKGIFNEKTLGDELLAVHNAGRYTSGATVRADLVPVAISLMDELARSALYEANVALEKKIDSIIVDNKYARRIPIFDEVQSASGFPLNWNSQHTDISQNYAFGQRSTEIRTPLDCTIARGNIGDIAQFGRSELVEANTAFDILKTESQINTLKTDTDLLVGMGKGNCFPGSKPKIDSYWGGNSVLRMAAGGTTDPSDILDRYPSTTQFRGFTAPIFSLGGMKETDRLTPGSVRDCLKAPYQYTMSPARSMDDTDPITGESCSTAYPSEWTRGLCGRVGGTPRFTCISSVTSSGVNQDLESSIEEYKANGPAPSYSFFGSFGNRIEGDCKNGSLILDGRAIFTKNNICTVTESSVDEFGGSIAGSEIDITRYKNEMYHTIPSLMKHVSPTNEELNAAQSSGITPGIPVDMVRYVEFYTPKGNIARINYPNFFDIPSADVASARVWIKNQANTEWQKIINAENTTTTSAKYNIADGYLSAGVIPSAPIDWNQYISDDMILKILQAKHWLHPDTSLKYRQAIEAMLSYSHENIAVTPLVDTPPKIPSLSTDYEIAYLGLPSSFAADFGQSANSNSMAEYDAKLREIEGVNISDESKNDAAHDGDNNPASECGPPDGVPLLQWPSAIMCWIKAQFPPKILAGSCGPTSIGLDSGSKGANYSSPPGKIAQDPVALTAFYAGSRVIPHLPRSSMNLKDNLLVDLSLQKGGSYLNSIPNSIAHLEIVSVNEAGKSVDPTSLGNYIQISPENSLVGEKGASFILESLGRPAVVTLKAYYALPLPGGSDIRIDSSEFQVEVTPEYYTFGLEQSGASIFTIDATASSPVTLTIKKVLKDTSEQVIKTPVRARILDDVDGTVVYTGASFNPSQDALPTSVTKKVGVYRFIAEDSLGISGEFTFAVEPGILSQVRIVPISSVLVRGNRTLATVRLLDRIGNPIYPDIHSLKIDVTGGYLIDPNGEKKTTISMDTMEAQIPILIGSDNPGTMNISAKIDDTLVIGTKDITVYDSARIVLVRGVNPRVGGDPVPAHIEIQDDSGKKIPGLSSIASWKLPDGAGSFSKELITITDGLSEEFEYVPGTVAGSHSLSIEVPGIGSLTNIVFSLLPGDPLYISHTKDDENIVFSLRDRYGNIASLSTLAGTIARNAELPQAVIFSQGIYKMPIIGGYYTVDVPGIKSFKISYTDEYGTHVVSGVDRYVAYIVGKDEKVRFAPDYNARYTIFAGGSFLREGEDVLYNVTPGLSQSLAVSTVLDTPYKEDTLVSVLPGGSYSIGTTAQDVAIQSSISLSDGFPLLTLSDSVSRKQAARILYHMQGATLETCKQVAGVSCFTSKNTPTIRLITPENSDLTMSTIGDKVLLNSQGANILSVQNDGYVNGLSSITLIPNDSNKQGLGMSVMQNGKEIATILYITDSSLSVERANVATILTPRNTPVILSSGFSIQKMSGKVFQSSVLGYKIFRESESNELDEAKNAPVDSDSIGTLSEAPGVGWNGNNTMLLAYAGGDTVGESTKLFHTYTFVNLGDPVAHIDHGRPGTEIDGIDRTLGSIIARGTRAGIVDFFHRDMNADGNTDLIILYQDGYVELFLNLGGKFRSRGMIAYNKDLGTSQLKFGDFTHDGYGDIFGLNKEGSLILIDNSIRKFSRPNITLEGGAQVPKHISQFRVYDMDADMLDDIVYITAGGELGILYGTATPGNFIKKILDPTLGISLSEDPITTGGAIRADNTPRFVGPLEVSPVENTGSDDDTMLKNEVYYQYVHPAPEISEDTNLATLSGVYTDIANGRTGQSEDTFVRSQYATAYGLNIEKKYTNTTHTTLYPDDLIQARISIKNTTNQTIKNIEYLDVVPKIFSLDKTEKYTVSIGGTSIDRPFESISSGDYDMYFVGRDIPPGETLEISYDIVALPASYGEMIVGDLERNTVGTDNYGDVGFKTSTTCGASMLLWTSGPGARDYTKGTHEFGAATLPDGLASKLADSDGNSVPDSIEKQSLAERQKTYTNMTKSNSENKPLVKVTNNGGGQMTIGFDSETEDSIIDATQNLLDGLACGFGGGSCMSFPMNWAPLAPGSDPVMFGKLLGDGLKVNEGLPIFAALTRMDIGVTPWCVTIPMIWPITPLSLNASVPCSSANVAAAWGQAAAAIGSLGKTPAGPLLGAGGMIGAGSASNFLRIFVTPTLTLGVGTAICLGGPASTMGKIPPSGLSPFIQGGNCIVMAKPMAVCKGDGSIADGNVAPISGLGTLSDTWNATSCRPKVSGGTEIQNQAITTDIVKYLKTPNKSMLAGIYSNMSKRGAQSISLGPVLRVGNASGAGAGSVEVDIESGTKISDISQVIKLKNIRIPAFPDFIMNWLTRQTEEIVTSLFTPPNLTIIPPTDFDQNASPDSSFDGISKKLGKLYSNANIDNIKQGMSTAMNGKKPNTDAMKGDAKATVNTIKSAYTVIGKLPYIKINQVNIVFNIPWIKMSDLDKYGRALDGYIKEIDKAMKNLCVSDPSLACVDKKAKIQSGPFINSIRQNLSRIEEYKRFPTKVIKYLTWKDRYIAQILCNINIIQQVTGGWLRDNGIRFRKWAELYVLLKAIADGWQPLLDIFLDTSVSCGVCRNERGNAQSWKFKLISALLPSIPVIKFPKWPDVILDLSDIRFAITFGMPNFDVRFSPIRLPNLPSLSLGDLSAGISLPPLPIIPGLPPLPELPDLPSLPKIKLPDLPPPPKVPKISGSIQAFLKILKLISKMYCYYQKTVLIPEWQAGDVIAQRTERQGTSLFDFLTIATPQFSLPTLKEIRVATHVNFELKSDFIAEFSRAAVKPVNKFGTDFQNILPKKIGEDIAIQGKKIDLNKKLPYNLEKSIHTASGFVNQIFAELENNKDIFLDVEDFSDHLLRELDDPRFADQRSILNRELSVARIESKKVQNELIAYNDRRFDLLKDYISAENDNNAQLRNIIDLLMNRFDGEPRQLISSVSSTSNRSANLLKKFNESQDQDIENKNENVQAQEAPIDSAKKSLQGKLARVFAATTGGGIAGSPDVAEGYSPNYHGIYIQTPSGIQTQLFDYTSALTEDTRVDTIDIDKDGDMDYIYLLDGILYVKYSWKNTPKKILDTTTKIFSISPSDLVPYTPDYFHENNSLPKNLNFSFVPSNHDETEWRADFYDRYIEWDHVDIGDHDPKTTPKTTIDMFLSEKNSPIPNAPIASTHVTRSLDSVKDTASFVLQGRRIDIYTGALSISLSPGRVLYTGRESVSITYKDTTMTGSSQSITLAPYTGYEFINSTEVVTSGGRLYLIGDADNSRYTYSDDFIGMPILPGIQIYASDRGSVIRNHTSGGNIVLGGGSTYITYDLGDKEDSYSVALPYANGYYYSRLQNLTSKKMDRAGVILFAPQKSSDDGAPLVDLPEHIRLPIYSNKTYKISDFLTDLSDTTLSIDSDLTIDSDGNGIFDDDFAVSGSGFTISAYELVFGKFTTPGNYEMSLKAVDEMGNTTIMPLTIEAYTPVPKIQNVTLSGNLVGSISEPVLETPIHFFRVRSGEVPKILSPEFTLTDSVGNFLTGSFFNSSEIIRLKTGNDLIPMSSHGVLQLPSGYTNDVVPATDTHAMEILTLDPASSISHRHTLALPDDVIFTDVSKDAITTGTGIFITPVAFVANVVPVSSSDTSIPGGVYITDSSYQPLAAMARDGNIYVLESGITLKYGAKDGYITIDILRDGISITSIEYKIDFFYTSK